MADALAVPVRPYAAVRPLIRSGDLLLCSGSSVMSAMIQAATNSSFSHVAFLLHLAHLDRILVLESVESIGIRACTLGSYVRDYNGSGRPYPGTLTLARHQQIDLADHAHWQRVSRTAVDLLGYPYGAHDILDITARIIGAKLGLVPRPVRNDKAYICSEFCQLILESIGVHIPYDRRGFIAPADFARCPEIALLATIATAAPLERPV